MKIAPGSCSNLPDLSGLERALATGTGEMMMMRDLFTVNILARLAQW